MIGRSPEQFHGWDNHVGHCSRSETGIKTGIRGISATLRPSGPSSCIIPFLCRAQRPSTSLQARVQLCRNGIEGSKVTMMINEPATRQHFPGKCDIWYGRVSKDSCYAVDLKSQQSTQVWRTNWCMQCKQSVKEFASEIKVCHCFLSSGIKRGPR